MQQILPRSEYPRPQFVRRDWQNLNGDWEFAFDDADEGLSAAWNDGRALPQRITVPFAYQTELSGINDKSIHEIVWYARDFEVPAAWRDGDVLLHFGAVDYRTTVWINGQEVGHNQGGHVPFWFDIAPYLQEGRNRVTVRVEDRQDACQPRGKQSVTGVAHHIDYSCTTGIWQSVWLEPVPPMRIQELNITPHLEEGALEVRVFLHAPAAAWQIQIEVRDGGEIVARAEENISNASTRVSLTIPNAKAWSPSSPHLYDLRVRLLQDAQVLDEVESYAGLRTVRLQDKKFFLNGEPTYLAMVLDQGYWPDGGMTAPTDDALRADVEWTKRLGFNGARKHQKVEDPRYLYWCDKLGVLVWGEMANARAWSPQAEEQLISEWERVVRRDANHPCIVTWVPLNESMGAPQVSAHPGQYSFVERVVALTRRLDPERPVIDNDGWEHTDVTDIFAIHDYTPTREKLHARYAQTLEGGALPKLSGGESADGQEWGLVLLAGNAAYHGQPVVLSEVAGLMMQPPDLSQENRDVLYDVYAVCRTPEELLRKYRDIMQGVAELPFVCGFCTTQLADVEQEVNGLLSYDRRPKIEPELIAQIHREFFGVD
jgi:beta-galactosidase/beta-glucuronidase